MACKLFVLAAVLAIARAGIIGAPAVVAPGATIARAAPLAYAAAPAPARAVAAPVAVAHAAPVAIAAPVARAVAAPVAVDTDYDPNPQYSYAYDVQDALTGDSKSQQESRSGDVVQGSYSLLESDGTRRTVDYIADPVNGFNAVVHREPAVAAAAVTQAPVAVAAPVVRYAAAAPVARAVPAPAVAYAAPVARAVAAPAVAYAAPARLAFAAAPLAQYATAPALTYGVAGVHTKAILG